MTTEKFSIAFPFQVENGALIISIRADVERDPINHTYHVCHFRLCSNPKKNVLPNVHLKRWHGRWVHVDSEKETYLQYTSGQGDRGPSRNMSGYGRSFLGWYGSFSFRLSSSTSLRLFLSSSSASCLIPCIMEEIGPFMCSCGSVVC